jgi:hypothetical protein
MSNHVGFPGERTTYQLTVKSVVVKETNFGPIADHILVSPEGNVFFWQASNNGVWLNEGQSYTVKATVKTHDADDSGVKRTILTRVSQVFEPPRVPRVAMGLSRHR